MSYEVKTAFTCRLLPEMQAALNKISQENDCESPTALLEVLISSYSGSAPPVPAKKPTPANNPTPGASLFVAEIDPLDADNVASMRKLMYQRHKMRDAGILAHWAQVFADIEDQKLFMVRPPKNTRDLIVSQGQPEIDEGNFRDLGQFIAKKLQESMKEKKGGWFD